MNDINEMPPKCQYCPYWEVCEYPWVCPDREQLATKLQPTCSATDTISRKAAIDAVHKSYDMILDFKTNGKTISSSIEDILSNLPSARSEQRWTPCDKGEPDEDMECWVTVKTTDALYRGNFTKRYGERRDKGFITSGGFMWWNTALAWMPVYEPEPYKEEEQDG